MDRNANPHEFRCTADHSGRRCANEIPSPEFDHTPQIQASVREAYEKMGKKMGQSYDDLVMRLIQEKSLEQGILKDCKINEQFIKKCQSYTQHLECEYCHEPFDRATWDRLPGCCHRCSEWLEPATAVRGQSVLPEMQESLKSVDETIGAWGKALGQRFDKEFEKQFLQNCTWVEDRYQWVDPIEESILETFGSREGYDGLQRQVPARHDEAEAPGVREPEGIRDVEEDVPLGVLPGGSLPDRIREVGSRCRNHSRHRRLHDRELTMTGRCMAWGFLTAGFLGLSTLFFQQNINDAFGVTAGLAGLWCGVLTMFELVRGGDSDE